MPCLPNGDCPEPGPRCLARRLAPNHAWMRSPGLCARASVPELDSDRAGGLRRRSEPNRAPVASDGMSRPTTERWHGGGRSNNGTMVLGPRERGRHAAFPAWSLGPAVASGGGTARLGRSPVALVIDRLRRLGEVDTRPGFDAPRRSYRSTDHCRMAFAALRDRNARGLPCHRRRGSRMIGAPNMGSGLVLGGIIRGPAPR